MSDLDPALAEELWRRGELAWKLRPYQLELYAVTWAFLRGKTDSRKLYVDCHRRYGKSFVLFTVAVEVGLGKAPGVWSDSKRIIRFSAPTTQDLEEIYHPIAEDLFEDCPDDIRPQWRTTRGRGHYLFPSTGSQLHLFGVDAKHYRKARGKKCHFAVPDEIGACEPGHPKGIEHVVNAILLPQTFGCNGRIVMPTTPPETPGHPSEMLLAQCKAAGAYLRRSVQETEAELKKHFGEGIIDEYAREYGGRQSTAFRREYGCEHIVDEESAIVPEFTEEAEKTIAVEWPRPPHWEPYEAMDPGFDPSHTGVLYGYYDFLAAKLVVEDETDLRRMRTDLLASEVAEKERALWPEKADRTTPDKRIQVPHRWSDIDAILLNDLAAMHKLSFAPTSKDTLEAMVNKVRIWVRTDRLRINPRCTNLLAQLRAGVFNKSRTEFAYSPSFGHYDLLAALVYMVRNCPETRNPYPAIPLGVSRATHHIPAEMLKPQGNEAVVGEMFRIGGRKKT